MDSRPPRTLVFGLDGFDLLHAGRLASAGRMPWLASIFQSGSMIMTKNADLPGSEWVNAACGVDPSHHGYLHTSQIRVGSYEHVGIDASIVQCDPFYVPLVRAGHKCVVVDLCVDRPRPQRNLVQVIDWATEFKLWRYCTTPASIRSVVKRVGHHPFTRYPGTDPTEERLLALRGELLQGTRLKGALVRRLMDEHADWQVFFAGFCESHKAGHFFWQFRDPSHPRHAGEQHPLADAMDESYAALDEELRQTAAKAGPDVNIVIVTDRGMRANLRGDHLIEPLLVKLGLLSYARPAGSDEPGGMQSTATRPKVSLARRLKERVPVGLRPLLRGMLGRRRYDWDRTRMFPVPDVGNSYLRVNLRGREPAGTVRADQYDALLNYLRQELESLVNPLTGTCPVREVVFPRRQARGPLRDWLPDLGVVWRGDGLVNAVCSPAIGRLEGSHEEQRSGNHSEQGGIVLHGPRFVERQVRDGDLRELAPTLLALCGVPIPEHYAFRAPGEVRCA